MDNNDEIIPIDNENFRWNKNIEFSHQSLVMRSMNKCIEAGCKEMRSGYWNEKSDKFGNVLKVYVPDTRKEFIENVKNTEIMMACDMDKEATDNIKATLDKMEKKFNTLCTLEEAEWTALGKSGSLARNNRGIFFMKGTLNTKLPYFQEYLEFEVNCYREILRELCCLTSRLKFYASQDYEEDQEVG